MKDTVTILDVAKRAGVSPATVTHALNGKRPVGEQTRAKVLSAIAELGYVPSWNASRLKSGSSGIIGCLAVDITESFVSRIVKGMESGLGSGQYSLLFVSAVEFDGDLKRAYNFLKGHNVDGTLLCYHIPNGDTSVLSDIVPFCPMVSVNMAFPGMPSIVLDNVAGGLQAAEHLVSCGVKHPAIICGQETRVSAIDRLTGFSRRIQQFGLALKAENILFGDYQAEHGYVSAKRLLENDAAIDGIFCENDFLAAGAINAIKDLGYSVPEDIKILGFDNRDFSVFWAPPISTFEIPLHDMGLLGMYKLKEMIETKKEANTEVVTLQPKILPRKSTEVDLSQK
ncbi:LacI family DNA-binding transcriptional regulator [uncultured Sphaerochaeta sp.]|uniref:LacI family DNA-binding transcriptional regulator n=1 Tax=uncultured Sphaerochaeta sp. TaxID=886478 RepID=UPI002A0A26CA|nr:LacI family DNA-binding transcriptional regulator [uncultured Sphaerochaeta sp.]